MTIRLSVCVAWFLGPVSVAAAQGDLTLLPQNVLVTNMAPGDRGQVTLFLEWDRPMRLVKSGDTVYQLGRSCGFKFTPPDSLAGANSGLMQMTGPGPHYRVAAVCNCNRGQVALGVRVYDPTGEWVAAQTVPGGAPIVGRLNWIRADCGR